MVITGGIVVNFHDITKADMLNGSGLRTVLWVSGCEQHCPNCQNPQTHPKDSGIPFDKEAEEELFESLKPDYIAGLTVTGGHPLEEYNYSEVLRLCKKCKQLFPNKTIWVYTGYTWEHIKDLTIMKYIDVLVDGRFLEELADVNYPYAGSTNQKVIDVQKSLETGRAILYCK